jgi:hypothetical protein
MKAAPGNLNGRHIRADYQQFGPSPDGYDVAAEFIRELNPQMTETAYPLNDNKIAGTSPAVARRIKSGDAGAEHGATSTGATMYSA